MAAGATLNRITNTEPGADRRLRFVTVRLVKHWLASCKTPLAERLLYTDDMSKHTWTRGFAPPAGSGMSDETRDRIGIQQDVLEESEKLSYLCGRLRSGETPEQIGVGPTVLRVIGARVVALADELRPVWRTFDAT